ncbi:MAG: hypothetical protein ABFS21_06855 [Actinomycetota bacterium]
MIETAYLRVYVVGDEPDAARHVDADDRSMKLRSDGRFIWGESLSEDAFVAEWSGTRYVCPRNTRLRMIEGVLAFSGSYPNLPLITEDEREAFKAELSDLRAADRRSHILASPWHVPLRWFGVFSESEREIYERGSGLGIRYRTGLGEAIDRASWAVRVLEGAGFPGPVVGQVRDLERWLAEFPVSAMLELDYASVADRFSDGDLTLDESATDVRESLEALESGDGDASRRAYGRVAGRWADRQALTFTN